MKKGKSRLKIYKRNKRLKKALFIGLIIDCLLWAWVFQSIKQLNKNNLQLAIIQKTIIKEVKAKTDYKIGLVTAYSCNGLETQAEQWLVMFLIWANRFKLAIWGFLLAQTQEEQLKVKQGLIYI